MDDTKTAGKQITIEANCGVNSPRLMAKPGEVIRFKSAQREVTVSFLRNPFRESGTFLVSPGGKGGGGPVDRTVADVPNGAYEYWVRGPNCPSDLTPKMIIVNR